MRVLTTREIVEWLLYEQIEPFGEWRADLRAGIVASTFVNLHRPRGRRALSPQEFMPRFGESRRQSPEQLLAQVAQWNQLFGGKDLRR